MNKKEKIDLIMQDERNRIEEEKNNIELLMQGPSISSESVNDDYQYKNVATGASKVEVFSIEVPTDKALIIDYIANDWYPGIEYDFITDGATPMGKVEREVAPTNSPTNIDIICKDHVRWLASNSGEEDRVLGVVTGGRYVPEKVYDKWKRIYQ